MKKIITIAQKELFMQFRSPMAYILLCLTLSIFHFFFYLIIDHNQEATLRDVFKIMEFLFVFLIPLMTMKLIAEEKFTGTMEFLRTTPTSKLTIVLGKYFGALAFYTFMIFLTFVYAFLLELYSQPDRIVMAVGYFGIWLEGAFFIAIGLMTSSWTKNQILAAMTSYVILLFLYFNAVFVKYVPVAFQTFVQYMSCMGHLENLARGIVSTADLTYFMSGIFVCLVMTRLSLEKELWRS